jgi:hypothetical protein
MFCLHTPTLYSNINQKVRTLNVLYHSPSSARTPDDTEFLFLFCHVKIVLDWRKYFFNGESLFVF